ncbi:MAG: beta-N-acetylhexosaminidase [Hyphomicrobiaceae bacterium]|nr:beta-N-acetylhexosaminidase [Hyphomicrobiaceae bacterium]
MRSAMIVGLAGPDLARSEARFLRETAPAGVILFARNCVSHEQIRRLVGEARSAIGSDDVLVLIDQEGGRVQRLRPPLGRALPPARVYGDLYRIDPVAAVGHARQVFALLAADLRALGIDCDCAPVLDRPVPGAHDIIGDRAFAGEVAAIVALGRAVAEGLMAGGVVPVVKHMPGHGRAGADSHLELPRVSTSADELAATDFAPFAALADLPAAMTAHVVYDAIDPAAPATTSRTVVAETIRGSIGFDGLLMSDDLSMRALAGPLDQRARASLAAGCDVVLHCNGDFAEMSAVAESVPELTGRAAERFAAAVAVTRRREPLDAEAAEAALTVCLEAARRGVESV